MYTKKKKYSFKFYIFVQNLRLFKTFIKKININKTKNSVLYLLFVWKTSRLGYNSSGLAAVAVLLWGCN